MSKYTEEALLLAQDLQHLAEGLWTTPDQSGRLLVSIDSAGAVSMSGTALSSLLPIRCPNTKSRLATTSVHANATLVVGRPEIWAIDQGVDALLSYGTGSLVCACCKSDTSVTVAMTCDRNIANGKSLIHQLVIRRTTTVGIYLSKKQ